MFDRPFESFGICSNADAIPYVVVILVLNIVVLIAANWWAYQSRNIETEYHESRYVGISMASILQAWCMGIPILIVVWDNPQAKFFVEAGIVFVTALAVLLLVFVPKMLAIHADRVKAAEESKRIAYTNFTARSRRNQFDMEEDEEKDKTLKSAHAMDDTCDKDTSDSSPDERKLGMDVDHPEAARRSRVESSLEEEPNMQELRGTIAESIRSLHMSNTNTTVPVSPGSSGVDFDGLRITHNPRSARNLRVSGGVEYSRAQLENLEHMHEEGVYLEEENEEDLAEEDEDHIIDPLDPESGDARMLSQ